MPGFAAAHIEGVELYNVGQQTDLGKLKSFFMLTLNYNYIEMGPCI